jgi:hypothetical protein
MAVTNVQQGVITEADFAKICILTSNGRLFHKHPLHGVGRGATQLHFKASMEPNAKGMWTQSQSEVGQRMLRMLNAQPGQSRLDPKVEQLIAMSGTVWLHRPPSIVVPRRHRAA